MAAEHSAARNPLPPRIASLIRESSWIAMLGVPSVSWPWLLAAFVLFRLFDVWKPGPVGWADRWHTPAGVIADDVVAGAIAAVVLGRWLWVRRA